MKSQRKRLLVIQAAGLGYDFLDKQGQQEWQGLTFRPMDSVFPAVTCPVQASLRTGLLPGKHGMVANSVYLTELKKPLFWEQSSEWVQGNRLWESFRTGGGTVGMLFWQQSLGESVDMLLSPAPVHKHHGGMVQSCYEKPDGLYTRTANSLGRPFDLKHYWGPMASAKSSNWIANAVAEVVKSPDAPDLCFAYLPVLDYDLQRFGPDSSQATAALADLFSELTLLLSAAEQAGYDVIVFGDYAIVPVDKGAVLPNLALREAGLLKTRNIQGRLYPDTFQSKAFAVVDHEVAHVYTNSGADNELVADTLRNLTGVERVMDAAAQEEAGIGHARSGDLVLVAEDGYWFAYPWWDQKREAPDYASHVDIHNKPGYDPCELFFGWPPLSVSRDTQKIRGSHGKTGPGREVAWAATCPLESNPKSVLDLSRAIKNLLE